MRSPKSLLRIVFLVPFGLVTAILIALAVVFYRVGTDYVVKDVYSPHLLNMLSEKKRTVDALLGKLKKDIEHLSANAAIRDSVLILTRGGDKGDTPQKKAAAAAAEAQQYIGRFLDSKVFENYGVVAILSAEGRVLASTETGQVGEDWSEKEFFRQMVPDLKDATIIGFSAHGDSNNRMLLLAPIVDSEKKVIALAYSHSPIDKLVEYLRIQDDLYKTEKVVLIDKEGNVVLTAEGVPAKRTKHHPSIISQDNVVGYTAGMLYSSASLSQAPFRLMGTAERGEVLRVPVMLFILYCGVAVAIILIMGVQAGYFVPRFYTRPLLRLAAAAQAVARGDSDVDLGGGYRGESDKVKRGLEALIEALRGKEFLLRDRTASLEKSLLTSALFEKASDGLAASLKIIAKGLNRSLQGDGGLPPASRRTFSMLLSVADGGTRAVEDLRDLLELEKGAVSPSLSEFSLWELIREIEAAAGVLIGSKEIEVVSDCDRAFMDAPVYTDRDRLRRAVMNLLSTSIDNSETGAITLLTSRTEVEGQEHIEISVAETGRERDTEILKRPVEELEYPYHSVTLLIAERLTMLLRGKLEVEGVAGKGSVFTMTIPSRMASKH